VPVYTPMMQAFLQHLWVADPQAPLTILELGCGTGNLSQLLATALPNAHLTLLDISPDMIAQTQAKLAAKGHASERFTFTVGDMLTTPHPDNHFDYIVSSIAIHHLPHAQQAQLYKNTLPWLKPGGRLRIIDQCALTPAPFGPAFLRQQWLALSQVQGATPEELALWVAHEDQYDNHAPLAHHFQWLTEAGYTAIDCYWRQLYWTLFGAEKPSC